MMLTLIFPFEPPLSFSLPFSFTFPSDVDGWDLSCESVVEVVCEKRAWLHLETGWVESSQSVNESQMINVGVGGTM